MIVRKRKESPLNWHKASILRSLLLIFPILFTGCLKPHVYGQVIEGTIFSRNQPADSIRIRFIDTEESTDDCDSYSAENSTNQHGKFRFIHPISSDLVETVAVRLRHQRICAFFSNSWNVIWSYHGPVRRELSLSCENKEGITIICEEISGRN